MEDIKSKTAPQCIGNTSNRYSILDDETIDDTIPINNEPKLPPILDTVIRNLNPLTQLLGQITKDRYILKVLANEQVKTQPKESKTYTKIIKEHSVSHTQLDTISF